MCLRLFSVQFRSLLCTINGSDPRHWKTGVGSLQPKSMFFMLLFWNVHLKYESDNDTQVTQSSILRINLTKIQDQWHRSQTAHSRRPFSSPWNHQNTYETRFSKGPRCHTRKFSFIILVFEMHELGQSFGGNFNGRWLYGKFWKYFEGIKIVLLHLSIIYHGLITVVQIETIRTTSTSIFDTPLICSKSQKVDISHVGKNYE